MNKYLRIGAAAALLSFTALAQPAFAGKADDTLNVAFTNEIDTLDYYSSTAREALSVGRMVYDGLVSKDFKTGEFVPELAESYKILSDTEIEFKIRKGVKFHNGDPLTADDVTFTLNMVSRPDFPAKYAIAVNWIDKAEKVDDDTVRLTMKAPYPLALEMLAGNVPIYPKAYYEKVGAAGMAVKPIGTGPYKVVSLDPGVEVNLERFDGYYKGGQRGNASIGKLHFRVLPEVNTQYAELMNGTVDWIWKVLKDDAPRLASRPNIKIETKPVTRFDYIAMDIHVPNTPVADIRVRQAINYAVNRKEIRDAFKGEGAPLIKSACNPVQFGCETDVTDYMYDPEKAKQLLKDAGFENGLNLSMIVSPDGVAVGQAIKDNLAAVGINLTLSTLQYSAAVEQWRGHKQDLQFADWGSYGIGDVALSTGAHFANTGDDVVNDPDVYGPVTGAAKILDPARRKELYSKALKVIADKAYWVPMWGWSMNTAMSSDLELSITPDEFIPFYAAKWK
ncbi:ABC transporter substrate-binding protein [Sinorhizobium meliloti]|uniref:ABC transporter substrate-binding protein n=1 Tax=Rhizobium meliloti TaxID=382 RepID=UPI000FDC117B|nr:ABC transporter substrate-binding protein [Sinorhizobium meliloti]RVG23088.1 ABC transporter substrate-binding protein [Sinorhizobium meliloti]RVL00702.1 ABC transporter substrate-binding protein [Sinorhizobium meliloti]RVN46437.1 ABC transporter substrate-binding protein [Sinorhizobium meliloti]